MVNNWSIDQLHACVHGGEDKFIYTCRHAGMDDHGFQYEDYHRIFAIIAHTASLNPQAGHDYVNSLVSEAN